MPGSFWTRPAFRNTLFWFFVIGVIAVVIGTCTIIIEHPAQAHMHDAPELDAWFNGLSSKNGSPCCSYTDGSAVADVNWDTAIISGKTHYRVFLEGRWVVVTDEEVVEAPNLYKRAVVWTYRGVMGLLEVRCFMPGAGT
jgi:hypothetical protein